MTDDKPTAHVTTGADGGVVLVDPVAVEVAMAVAKHNCRATLKGQAERVAHFESRRLALGRVPAEVVVVLVNVDAPLGDLFAHALMPGFDWQAIRDAGEVPFARGLAARPWMQSVLFEIDPKAAEKLKAMTDVAVVVVDHGAVEIFSVADATA